jgi:hypothetical protein
VRFAPYPLLRFGNPANSKSPVALRPLLAKGLPFLVGDQVAPNGKHRKPIALRLQGGARRVNTPISGVNTAIVAPLSGNSRVGISNKIGASELAPLEMRAYGIGE